jgi:hypothetical protein
MGTWQTVNVRISNINFGTLDDATAQFNDQGQVQLKGNMGKAEL